MKYITAGILTRRMVRRFLLESDVDFIEEKGFIDSVFYLKCTDEKYNSIVKIINIYNKES